MIILCLLILSTFLRINSSFEISEYEQKTHDLLSTMEPILYEQALRVIQYEARSVICQLIRKFGV